MIKQEKDKFYDIFLKEPTKDNFRKFLKESYGELDEIDFKEEWIEKGKLAKTMLAMANSRGGIIVIGVKEGNDGTTIPVGLSEFKDKAKIHDEISNYIPPELAYKVFDFNYDASEYEAVQNKKFQLLMVYDTPERLPFISKAETTGLKKDEIYIRRGTECEKASASEIERILDDKISAIFKETSDLSLEQHLQQLKVLYDELPKKIKKLVRKGKPGQFALTLLYTFQTVNSLAGEPDEYEEIDNPNYPEESYEAFISRMIKVKKIKIEKVLDLK